MQTATVTFVVNKNFARYRSLRGQLGFLDIFFCFDGDECVLYACISKFQAELLVCGLFMVFIGIDSIYVFYISTTI